MSPSRIPHFRGMEFPTDPKALTPTEAESRRRIMSSVPVSSIQFPPGVDIGSPSMNLQLHGIESPNLMKNDALSENAGSIRDQFSLVLANPPFKGSLDYDSVEASILKTVKSKKLTMLLAKIYQLIFKLSFQVQPTQLQYQIQTILLYGGMNQDI